MFSSTIIKSLFKSIFKSLLHVLFGFSIIAGLFFIYIAYLFIPTIPSILKELSEFDRNITSIYAPDSREGWKCKSTIETIPYIIGDGCLMDVIICKNKEYSRTTYINKTNGIAFKNIDDLYFNYTNNGLCEHHKIASRKNCTYTVDYSLILNKDNSYNIDVPIYSIYHRFNITFAGNYTHLFSIHKPTTNYLISNREPKDDSKGKQDFINFFMSGKRSFIKQYLHRKSTDLFEFVNDWTTMDSVCNELFNNHHQTNHQSKHEMKKDEL